jgi:AbrB family looped-hinge helix DNA binding protein
MVTTTLTSKGRITVPKEVRDFLGIGPGSKVTFEVTVMGDVMLRPLNAQEALPGPVASVRGSATAKMSTDEILRLTRGNS